MKIMSIKNINNVRKQNGFDLNQDLSQTLGNSLTSDVFVKAKIVSFTALSPEVQKELDYLKGFLDESMSDANDLDDAGNEISTRRGLWEYNAEFLTNYDKANTIKYYSKAEQKHNAQLKPEIFNLLEQYSSHEKNKSDYAKEIKDEKHFDEELKAEATRVKNLINKNNRRLEILKPLGEINKDMMSTIEAIYSGADSDKSFYTKEFKPKDASLSSLDKKIDDTRDSAWDLIKWVKKNDIGIKQLQSDTQYQELIENINYYRTNKKEIQAQIADLSIFTSPKEESEEIFRKNWLKRLNNAFEERTKKLNEIYDTILSKNSLDFKAILKNEQTEVEKLTELISKKMAQLRFGNLPF